LRNPLAVLAAHLLVVSLVSADPLPGGTDDVTSATSMTIHRTMTTQSPSKTLIILSASNQGSTKKVSNVIQEVLGADVVSPDAVSDEMLVHYSLIGFGSGIFEEKHHPDLLALVGRLGTNPSKIAFLFSTSGMAREKLDNQSDPHKALRETLVSKGFLIAGEFNCLGLNDNSFLKFFGGMNRNHPDQKDLQRAHDFARSLVP